MKTMIGVIAFFLAAQTYAAVAVRNTEIQGRDASGTAQTTVVDPGGNLKVVTPDDAAAVVRPDVVAPDDAAVIRNDAAPDNSAVIRNDAAPEVIRPRR